MCETMIKPNLGGKKENFGEQMAFKWKLRTRINHKRVFQAKGTVCTFKKCLLTFSYSTLFF